MADVPFTSFAFKATGGAANRTMPDRLAEEKNVLDFGANPLGAGNSTSAIQAAITAARAAGSGVFFPPGTYNVQDSGSGSAILLNDDVDFAFYMRGSGGGVSIIQSTSCPGYLVDRSLATPHNTIGPRIFENLGFSNVTSGGGGLRIGSSVGVVVRGCNFGAPGIGLTTEDSPGNSSQNITIDTCNFGGVGSTSSIGLVMGGSGSMTSTEFNGIWTANRFYGGGITCDGNRCERCNTAVALGIDSAGTDRGLAGFSMVCQEMEGVVNFIDFIGTVTGFSIGSFNATGHDSSNAGLSGHEANSAYGIRIRANKAYFGEFFGGGSGSFIDIGGIYMEDYAAPKRSFVTFSSCIPTVGAGAGVPWRIPSASAWPRFIESGGIDSSSGPPYGTRYLFSGLPTGGDVLEGDEFDISDGNSATIGASVTAGGGSNRIRVRWNGTNWICTV